MLFFAPVIIGLATAMAYMLLRRRHFTHDSVADRTLTWTTIAVMFAGIVILGIGIGVAIQQIFYEVIDITIPLRTIDVDASTLTPDLTGPQIYDMKLREATLSIANLPVGTRVLISLGALLTFSALAIIALLIFTLTIRLRERRVFDAGSARLSRITALIILVFGLAGDILNQFGVHAAAHAVLSTSDPDHEGPFLDLSGIHDMDYLYLAPPPGWSLTFQLWPLLTALAIAAFTILMQRNQRLTAELAVLQKEVLGLV